MMPEYNELSEAIQNDIITYMDHWMDPSYYVEDFMVDALCQIVVDRVKEAEADHHKVRQDA